MKLALFASLWDVKKGQFLELWQESQGQPNTQNVL
jgi:hypothetical protein